MLKVKRRKREVLPLCVQGHGLLALAHPFHLYQQVRRTAQNRTGLGR
jgi:hypothetical protein